jgi:signal peptidase
MSLLRELAIAIPIFIIAMIIASQLVVVPTSSMTPTIVKGDMVVVEKNNILDMGINETNPENIKVGDVIVYAKNASGVTEDIIHRVVAINETGGQKYYVLKGDNNTIDDPVMVPTNAVIGEAVNWNGKPITIPSVGWIFLWLKGAS